MENNGEFREKWDWHRKRVKDWVRIAMILLNGGQASEVI